MRAAGISPESTAGGEFGAVGDGGFPFFLADDTVSDLEPVTDVEPAYGSLAAPMTSTAAFPPGPAGQPGMGFPPGVPVPPGMAFPAGMMTGSGAVPAARPGSRPVRRDRSRHAGRNRSPRWVAAAFAGAVVVLAVAGLAGVRALSLVRSTGGTSAAAGRSVHVAGTPGATSPAASLAGAAPSRAPTSVASAAPGSARTTPAPGPVATPPAPVQVLPVSQAMAFGAGGVADGDHPETAARAITPGGSAGPWQTQWYATPQFGMLKQGTGLLLDMGKPVTVTSVTIQLGATPGAALQLRDGNDAELGGLPVVATVDNAGGLQTLKPGRSGRVRYVLIWLTKLPPTGTGMYQASIYSVQVAGRR
jgi:hypothetical protein